MIFTCCSDLHHGPAGHPACDETPGWAPAWSSVRGLTWQEYQGVHPALRSNVQAIKLRFGDMDELLQFTRDQVRPCVGTDVAGNHDPGTAPAVICYAMPYGLTLFLHGHQFDPWWARLLSRPAAKVAKWLECCIGRDADVRLARSVRRRLGLGRHGQWTVYAQRAARYAASRGASRIVFGHLHHRHEAWLTVARHDYIRSVHVVCTGCCCNGRMDFVEVEV